MIIKLERTYTSVVSREEKKRKASRKMPICIEHNIVSYLKNEKKKGNFIPRKVSE